MWRELNTNDLRAIVADNLQWLFSCNEMIEGTKKSLTFRFRRHFLCIDSTSIWVHPDTWCQEIKWEPGHWAFKGGLTTKLHLCCISGRYAFAFHLSAGNRHDAPEGRKLIGGIYSGDSLPFWWTGHMKMINPCFGCIPPKKNRREPWDYDRELYKRRNEVERCFLRLKHFRKVFTRYDKLSSIFLSVVMLAMIFDAVFMWTGSKEITKRKGKPAATDEKNILNIK